MAFGKKDKDEDAEGVLNEPYHMLTFGPGRKLTVDAVNKMHARGYKLVTHASVQSVHDIPMHFLTFYKEQ